MALPDRGRGSFRQLAPQPGALPPVVSLVNGGPPDHAEVMHRLWRHRWLIALCTVVIGGLGALAMLRMPSYYVGEARVLVGVPQTRINNVEPFQTPDLSNPDAERVQNEAFVMQSRSLARQVIDELNLRDDPEFNPWAPRPHNWRDYLYVEDYLNPLRYVPASWTSWLEGRDRDSEAAKRREAQRREERLIDILLGHVDVATLGRSQVLSIKVSSEDPEHAAQIANALAAAYLRQQREEKVATITRVEDYLSKRVDEMYGQVAAADRAVAVYRRDHGIYTTSTGKDKDGKEGNDLTTAQLAQLNSELMTAQTAKAEVDARLKEATSLKGAGLQATGADAVPDVLKSPLIQSLKSQQAQIEGKLADLTAQYGAKHPLIINARAEAADVRGRISREMDHIIGGIRQEARTADARYAALTANFDRLQKTMAGVNDKSIQLAALERDATVNRSLLEALLSRLRESYGRDALQTADARLISTAAAPDVPSYPPKGLILAFAGLVGLGAGTMLAFTRDNIDATFRRSDQLEGDTGLPVMAMVPDLIEQTPPSVHVLRQPISAYAEAIRRLHVGLELSDPERPPRTVMFASACPAEGKSVMVASLGRLLAGSGKNVLLIDCDWRAPRLHHLFRCPNTGGLAALLEDESPDLSAVIHNDELSGLDLIVAGSWDPRAIHKLTSERMRLVLQTFSKNYDVVLLDGPPVLSGAEMLNIARMTDKVCFVVRWGHTRRDVALQGIRQLIDAGADLAGLVLSRVDLRRYRAYSYGATKYENLRPSPLKL